MLLEQRLAAHLVQRAESLDRTPGDAACLSRFQTHSTVALTGTLAVSALLAYKGIDPKLLVAQPPRITPFAAQVVLVSSFALLGAFYATRFTSIQCTACMMGVDSKLGAEARGAVEKVNVNKDAFWALAGQIAGDRKAWVESERERLRGPVVAAQEATEGQ